MARPRSSRGRPDVYEMAAPRELSLNGDAKERRRYRRAGVARVLFVEQGLELGLQIRLAPVRRRSLECVHGRPVVGPELVEQLRRRTGEVECVGVLLEGDLLLRDTRGGEALDHVVLDAQVIGLTNPSGGGGE